MSRPVKRLTAATPVADAAAFFLRHGISGAPVIDGRGRWIGVFTQRDLSRHVQERMLVSRRERTLESWETLFAGERLPITAVKRVTEVVQDPQVKARGLLPTVDIPGLRKAQVIAHPAKHTATTTRNPARVPKKGQDTDSILRSIGYTTRQIADLTKRGVIAK